MAVKKRKLTFINDPGHAWLSVSFNDILELGIEDKISKSSFLGATRAYLEEDRDASIFVKAARDAGWDIKIKESHRERFDRGLADYNPYFIRNPLTDGMVVSYLGENGTIRQYLRRGRFRWELVMDCGPVFNLRANNPYLALSKPV